MRSEPQPFDVWLEADLRQRFGSLEQVPDDWISLVEIISQEE